MMSDRTDRDINIRIDPPPEAGRQVFRVGAADEILRLLVDAHDTEFTIPELVDATGAARSTIWRAVELLDGVGAVEIRETPQRNYVAVDRDRLDKPDPILGVPQSEFHEPIASFVERVREAVADSEEVDDLLGVVVFGSVARGEADRRSDVDLFVLVDGDRTASRRLVTTVADDLSERQFGGRPESVTTGRAGVTGTAGPTNAIGDRYAFEPYVETEASARRAAPKLNEIFDEGITVYGSERLQVVRKEVLGRE
jgi:predicted nucleotidyltransferase